MLLTVWPIIERVPTLQFSLSFLEGFIFNFLSSEGLSPSESLCQPWWLKTRPFVYVISWLPRWFSTSPFGSCFFPPLEMVFLGNSISLCSLQVNKEKNMLSFLRSGTACFVPSDPGLEDGMA